MVRIHQVEVDPGSPDGRWSYWIQPVMYPQHYRMACCDCGLVHDVEFKVEGGRVEFRVARNNRSTGQVRRRNVRKGLGVFDACGLIVREVKRMLRESDG